MGTQSLLSQHNWRVARLTWASSDVSDVLNIAHNQDRAIRLLCTGHMAGQSSKSGSSRDGAFGVGIWLSTPGIVYHSCLEDHVSVGPVFV